MEEGHIPIATDRVEEAVEGAGRLGKLEAVELLVRDLARGWPATRQVPQVDLGGSKVRVLDDVA